METKCKGCGKPVIFAKDETGKWQVLDAHAPVFLLKTQFGNMIAARELDAYVSHFSTCKDANKFSGSNDGK